MALSMTRRALVCAVLMAGLGVPMTAIPASAAGPTSITIAGQGLSRPLGLRADADPELFAAVLSQVAWIAVATGQTSGMPPKKLGPKYTVVVFVKDVARQTYDLYPLAEGGPRAHRPAKQPDKRKTTSAWFFGRLTMSETLRVAGVPLPIRPDALSGGIGGGVGSDTVDDRTDAASSFDPAGDMGVVFAQWRQLFLLNGAVVLLIALGLAGFSLLVRPKAGAGARRG